MTDTVDVFTTAPAADEDVDGASSGPGKLCGDIHPKSNITGIVTQKGIPDPYSYVHGVTCRGANGIT